jgi:hypothetical protein
MTSARFRGFFPLASDADLKDRRFHDDVYGPFDGGSNVPKGTERCPSFFPEQPITYVGFWSFVPRTARAGACSAGTCRIVQASASLTSLRITGSGKATSCRLRTAAAPATLAIADRRSNSLAGCDRSGLT